MTEFPPTSSQEAILSIPPHLAALTLFQRDASPPEIPVLRLMAVGDIAWSGRVRQTSEELGYDVILHDVATLFRNSDLIFGNLEAPLIEAPSGSLFAAPIEAAHILAQSGFHILHLANNHIADYGSEGLQSTLDTLDQVGLIPLGASRDRPEAAQLVRTDMKGLRIGWLGCGYTQKKQESSGPGYWEFDETKLLEAIKEARPDVDVLIVSIHIGLMYIDYPDPRHKAMAERLSQAGADLILMHHPHVLQGVEVINNRTVVCYSLGNFVFDWQEGMVKVEASSTKQTESAIFLFDLDARGVRQAAALPICIDEACRVRWPNPEHARAILQHLQQISTDLQSDFAPLFHQQRSEWHTAHILKVLWLNIKRGNMPYLWHSLTRLRPYHGSMILRWLLSHLQLRVR